MPNDHLNAKFTLPPQFFAREFDNLDELVVYFHYLIQMITQAVMLDNR